MQQTPSYLLFHDHSSDGSLDHVGAIQAVHAINSENPFLFTYHPSLIDPLKIVRDSFAIWNTSKHFSKPTILYNNKNGDVGY